VLDLPDNEGLICGFHFCESGEATPIGFDQCKGGQLSGPAWLHFRLSDLRAEKWLANCEQIPPRWRPLLIEKDNRVHFETSREGFAGVLGDLRFDSGTDSDHLGLLRLYVDEQFVFTVRLHPLKSLDLLRQEIRSGMAIHRPMDVVFQFLHDTTDALTDEVKEQGDLVDDTEDLVLKDRFMRESEDLGKVRRLLSRLRRHVDAQRRALNQLAVRPPRWFQEKDTFELGQAIDRLNAVHLDIEAIQERCRLLQDEIAGRVATATNQNLYVVSLLTAIFLPITLISGIFGMNVGGLPWENQQGGFVLVIGLMLATITFSLALLHWRRFF
jgi:zinc transporter